MLGVSPLGGLPLGGLPSSSSSTAFDAGYFTLTGEAALLKIPRTLTVAFGSFSETGKTATLKIAAKVIAAFGSFSETGKTATLKVAAKIASAYGSFVLTGKSAVLKVVTTANFALTGVYRLTGQAADFLSSKRWTKQDCTDSAWSRADEDCNCE